MTRAHSILAISVGADGALPTEFRLFVSGWNETENGRFLFDSTAAASVMAAYSKWGVDLAIDLEHQMLSEVSSDPTARDARGWCKLELRADGSLWAVEVKWTPDGAARLAQKRQRYISPAFEIDLETKRVSKMLNVALVAMPATHHTPALVAASAGARMDSALVLKALDALEAGDAKAALEILKGLIASAASGDPDAATEDAPPPAGDGGADEMTEAVEPAPPADPAKDKPEEVAAALSSVLRLSGKASFVAASADVAVWHASHLALETERQKLAAERAVLESAERRKGCIELVTQCGRAPATVWADDQCSGPKKYLASMSIADFRDYVADAIGSKSVSKTPKPPVSSLAKSAPANADGLSPHDLAICKETGCDPKVFAMLKARRASTAV